MSAAQKAAGLKALIASQKVSQALSASEKNKHRHRKHGENKSLKSLVSASQAGANAFSKSASKVEERRKHRKDKKSKANKMQFRAMMMLGGLVPKAEDDDNDGVDESTLVAMDLQGLCMQASSISDIAQRLSADDGYYNSVNFYQNDLGDAGARLVAHSLQNNKNLICINLGWNKIGDRGAKNLAKAMAVNQTVKWMDLRWNAIGNDGGLALAESVKTNSAIRRLTLEGNCLEDQAAIAFGDILRALPYKCISLNLNTNMITQVGLASLNDTSSNSQIDSRLQQAPEKGPGQFDGKAMDVLIDDPRKARQEDEFISMALADPTKAAKMVTKKNLNLYHNYDADSEKVKAMHALADLKRINVEEKQRLIDERREKREQEREAHQRVKDEKALEKRLAGMSHWEREEELKRIATEKADAA
jgi:hypothetical protein